MSQLVTWNGTNYTIPTTNEIGWGTTVTNWIADVSANAISATQIQTISNKTLQLNSGSAATPSLSFASDTASGLYLIGTSQLGFATAGTLCLTINANGDLVCAGTGTLLLPSGTTLQRPGSPIAGQIRYNTTNSRLEFFQGAAWHNVPQFDGNTVIDPGTGNAEIASPVNAKTATASYTYLTTDRGKRVRRSNGGSAMTDALPQAGASFPNGWWVDIINNDTTAALTITPTTSTIDGVASLSLGAGLSVKITSDGANYWSSKGLSAGGTVSSVGTGTGLTGGPVTTSGTISVGTNAITNALLAQMATNTIKGNNTGGTANAADLTTAQVAAILPAFVASGASHAQGLVPDPGSTAGTTRFLREDSTFAAPAHSVAGAGRNIKVVQASNTTATVSWDEIIAETALNGTVFKSGSQSITLNFATTGANGLDTGLLAASTFYMIYAIFSPGSTTWATLACTAAASSTTIYGGTHMPSGYTGSGLIGVMLSDGSSHLLVTTQYDREVFYQSAVNIFTGTTGPTANTLTSQSISAGVPSIAKTVTVLLGVSSGAQTSGWAASGDSTGTGVMANYGPAGASFPFVDGFNGCPATMRGVPILTSQTIYWACNVASVSNCRMSVASFTF